jgi:hypothetical protein
MQHVYWLAVMVVVSSPLAGAVEFQGQPNPPEEIPGIPPAVLEAVRVSDYPSSVVVPADVVLQQADLLQPVTEEGWIVTNQPACDGLLDEASRRYWDLDYPLQLRQYDTQIRLLQAELYNLWRRHAVYRYFNKTGVLMVTVQDNQLAILALHERLRNLRYERMLFIRHNHLERKWHHAGAIVTDTIAD